MLKANKKTALLIVVVLQPRQLLRLYERPLGGDGWGPYFLRTEMRDPSLADPILISVTHINLRK